MQGIFVCWGYHHKQQGTKTNVSNWSFVMSLVMIVWYVEVLFSKAILLMVSTLENVMWALVWFSYVTVLNLWNLFSSMNEKTNFCFKIKTSFFSFPVIFSNIWINGNCQSCKRCFLWVNPFSISHNVTWLEDKNVVFHYDVQRPQNTIIFHPVPTTAMHFCSCKFQWMQY